MRRPSCDNCGAPITVGTCRYCGTVVDAPEPPRQRIDGHSNTYDVLRNVDLHGSSNKIGEAHNCRVYGHSNKIDWADASTLVSGSSNKVFYPQHADAVAATKAAGGEANEAEPPFLLMFLIGAACTAIGWVVGTLG